MSLILRQCESLDAGMFSVYERLAGRFRSRMQNPVFRLEREGVIEVMYLEGEFSAFSQSPE